MTGPSGATRGRLTGSIDAAGRPTRPRGREKAKNQRSTECLHADASSKSESKKNKKINPPWHKMACDNSPGSGSVENFAVKGSIIKSRSTRGGTSKQMVVRRRGNCFLSCLVNFSSRVKLVFFKHTCWGKKPSVWNLNKETALGAWGHLAENVSAFAYQGFWISLKSRLEQLDLALHAL